MLLHQYNGKLPRPADCPSGTPRVRDGVAQVLFSLRRVSRTRAPRWSPSCGLHFVPSTLLSDRCKPCNRTRRPGTRSLCPATGDPCPEGRRPVRQARCRLTKALLASDTPRLRSGAGGRPDGFRLVTRSGSVQEKLFNPDKGFSGCGFELIAGLQVELGLERVDLVGGDGRDDVDEGVDDGSMLGQIEG